MLRPALLLAASLAAPATADDPDRPNVLLILTDDQGWGDVRSHGNPDLDTPHLDALAESGARFERFFVSPVCAPTRAALLTGRYGLRTGTHGVTRGHETMRSSEVTIAELLGGAGYATAAFGKWHNGAHWPEDPAGQGFGTFGGFCAGHWNNYFDPLLPHPPPHAPTRPEPRLPDGPGRVEGYIADIFTDAAVRFIGGEKDGPDPWFCYVAYNTPHWPPQVSDELFDKYAARGFDAKTASALAMCENLDRNVGRLLAALEAWESGNDTVVLFLTDNGPNGDRYNGGMRGAKGSCHEGGVRVPLFVRYPPKVAAGTVVERNAAHVDLLPTLCELCGVEPPSDRPIDGKSLVPLLVQNAAGELWGDRRLFTFKDWNGDIPTGDRGAVRTDRWRCVKDGPRWELFDMTADPGETTDVGDQYFDVRQELSDAFAAKWEEVTADGFEPIPITLDPPGGGWVELPAHEATLARRSGPGGIGYRGANGWANDYITDWTSPYASAAWPIRVENGGAFRISALHGAASGAELLPLKITVGDETRHVLLRASPQAHVQFPSPDRFDRGEVYEWAWGRTADGVIVPRGTVGPDAILGPVRDAVELPAGEGAVRILADPRFDSRERGGFRMPDIKAVRIRRVAPAAD